MVDLYTEIDKIAADLLKKGCFSSNSLDQVIKMISETINQYDESQSLKKKEKKVRNYILENYPCYYYYPEDVPKDSNLQLVSNKHDWDGKCFTKKSHLRRENRIVEIKSIPQYEQKSKAWLKQRSQCLTATAIATALNEDPYKYPIELFLEKCGRGTPFVENENVHHGKKYEEIGNMFYSFRKNVKVAEYGLIQHSKYPFIGASPDGICEKYTPDEHSLTTLVGRLLEIKFPRTRKIITTGKIDGDICPHYYYLQCQTQLFVTEMDECDFLQCKIEEYENWNQYLSDTHPTIPGLSEKTSLEKGCLIQLLPKNRISSEDTKMCLYHAQYIYPPKLHMTPAEITEWIGKETLQFHQNELYTDYMIDRIIFWRLSQIDIRLIKAEESFSDNIPILKQFWDYVLYYRDNEQFLNPLIHAVETHGKEASSLLFSKIHKQYLRKYPDTSYQPLYQESNPWRTKYDNKKKFFEIYQKNIKK